MKKTLIILLILLCIQPIRVSALSINQTSSFEELLTKTLSKLENNTSPDRFTTCVAELKRITSIYPKEWITYYYISLYEIQQTFNTLTNNNEDLLNDAIANINHIKKNRNADISEVNTIEGYYFYALIASNPGKNGQIYYKNVLDSYQKALKINPENPRAQLLLLIFKLKMAKFTGSKNNEEDTHNKLIEIENLFKKETHSYLKPSWGEKTLMEMLHQTDNDVK